MVWHDRCNRHRHTKGDQVASVQQVTQKSDALAEALRDALSVLDGAGDMLAYQHNALAGDVRAMADKVRPVLSRYDVERTK